MVYYWLLPDYGFDDRYSEEYYVYQKVMPFMLLAGLCTVLGHIFPIWLKFKGGKGVATAIGAYFTIMPLLGVIIIISWLGIFLICRTSSLSALGSFVVLLLGITCVTFTKYIAAYPLLIYSLVITTLIFWRHKDNIKRLLNRTEPKFGKQQ
jgi:glycerol-3-phosphate acyltransferase PlsY